MVGVDVTKMVVSDIDDHDWDGDSRPDHNIDGKSINQGKEVNEREEINTMALKGNMVTIEFLLSNGDSFAHRFNQGNAVATNGHNTYKIYSSKQYDYTVHEYAESDKANIPNLVLFLTVQLKG